jgi:uncharacterized protein (DUF1501 family)
VITLGYSEFGRRIDQNDSGNRAGTDHGRGGMLFLMGNLVAGGVYGRVPELNDPDEDGNLRVLIDFRSVYAAVIDNWLAGDHTAVLPGGPFTPLPVIT